MVEMHHHKLSLTICDYEQLISIGYKYNQFDIDDVVTIKSTGHKLESDHQIESYHQIKF